MPACAGRASSDGSGRLEGGALGQGGLATETSGGAVSDGGSIGAAGSGFAGYPVSTGGADVMGGSAGSTAGAAAGAPSGAGGNAAGSPATAGAGGEGGSAVVPAPRLIIFYTRWGTSYPDWWPTSDAAGKMQFTPMLSALSPFAGNLTLVSGLSNATESAGHVRSSMVNPDGISEASRSLLTAQPVVDLLPAGPSLDEAIDTCGGSEGPPIRLRVGEFAGDEGLFWSADGRQLTSEPDPHTAARRWLDESIEAPDPSAPIDDTYRDIGRAHMRVLSKALAARKACVATLSWGDAVRVNELTSLGAISVDTVHVLSHSSPSLYDAVHGMPPIGSPFSVMQRWYTRQFAFLLDLLQSTPFQGRTLFDSSVVLWISESGAGPDHTGQYIPVVLAGGALKALGLQKLDPPDIWTVDRTQGDLLSALARLWEISNFGAPSLTKSPLTALLP
ncbi:MAG TPA: DUF1552 domain-containing protein [Polyangiaceae bacterium]|nr:DUF1552 domain-containing protein [Polyangiaceae bacterium]